MTDITKQLAEALTECVDDSQAAVDQYVLNYGENWRPQRLAAMRKIVANARNALAAYRAQRPALVALTWAHIFEIWRKHYPGSVPGELTALATQEAIAEFCRVNGLPAPKAQEGE